MQVRTITIKRNGKTYSYAQLVESYRRESDGMPSHRIIANLGPPDSITVLNLREALAASRKGSRVARARGPARPVAKAPRPVANLRYLDLAVLLELWRGWKLDELIGSLMPEGGSAVPPQAVVCALALQRCVDPGSKLYASRWYPRTALAELLGVAPDAFNNTRVHRVLDELDDAGQSIQSSLARRYLDSDGAFAALFLDVTDAWFVGHGPSMAQRGKTKEGMIQRKIGIILMCNAKGYPLRWEVISGNEADCVSMSAMVDSVRGIGWAHGTPLVVDRAMGRTAQITQMASTGLWFLTALTVTEFDSYSDGLFYVPFAALEPRGGKHLEADRAQAGACAQAAGMTKYDDDLFGIDLGIVDRSQERSAEQHPDTGCSALVDALRRCREINQAIADGKYTSNAAAGRAMKMSRGLTFKYLKLGNLREQIQREVLDGRAVGCSLDDLISVAGHDATKQQQVFEQLLASRAQSPARKRSNFKCSTGTTQPDHQSIRVRAVAYFNPDRFVDQRLRARGWLASIQQWVDEFNAKLRGPRSKLNHDAIAASADRMLRKHDLVQAFKLKITEQHIDGRLCSQIELRLDQAQWAMRRRYDGFTVLVAHPDLPRTAEQLCRLYRQKDAVEKDFQVIKSLVQLRPIRHRNDGKVRAHVTLCMLALLLERTLQHRLDKKMTAAAAIEALSTCHLNRYCSDGGCSAYALTHTDAKQDAVLRTLRLQHLADDEEIAERITHR
jgi:hypothetical protein